ncbi:hypothetical protein C2E16_01560 [Mixta calida]|uniref:Secreted protein n=1 Tax=Mixta calida TaxID=665913 RepID=A0ABM6RXQ3_9GAMM|nr:hypothetical protein C2E16_01560 [Mixta calida]ORM63842.1 hypothetical protein HA40_00245 [Mixta calida]POU50683.1 hypothetical protein C3380_05365 [Pantoea sp. PSNIH5]POU69235.1 hypothetical protein C3374_06705 [Pantoea sp. PSNIH4]POY69233.1 hypothetical protein C3402_03915 [Pantoea sp. PSNIH3]
MYLFYVGVREPSVYSAFCCLFAFSLTHLAQAERRRNAVCQRQATSPAAAHLTALFRLCNG